MVESKQLTEHTCPECNTVEPCDFYISPFHTDNQWNHVCSVCGKHWVTYI